MQFEMEKTPQRQIYNLLIGLVAPRPIAWVTSMDEEGKLNAAPFSAYNYLCTDPPIVQTPSGCRRIRHGISGGRANSWSTW